MTWKVNKKEISKQKNDTYRDVTQAIESLTLIFPWISIFTGANVVDPIESSVRIVSLFKL